LTVPSGSRIAVDYSGAAPTLAVRLQEVFGWMESPRLAGGRVPVTLELLSPARRPVQVTRDLASFWARGYVEVKKELKGRYPKHYWPDDPYAATPTRKVRPPGD
jgi:ATP-dependent helicase HrpB